jgi:hypothetical protein
MTHYNAGPDPQMGREPVIRHEASVDEHQAEHLGYDGKTVRRWWGADVAGRVNSALLAALLALEVLLGVRFALMAFGANMSNRFVDFMMDVSWPFVWAFDGAFRNRTWDEGIIEVDTLLAMGVWLVMFAIAMMLVSSLLPSWRESYSERPVRPQRIVHHG